MRIVGDKVKNNCWCEKNNRQNVQEYKNRIIGQKKRNNLSRPNPKLACMSVHLFLSAHDGP